MDTSSIPTLKRCTKCGTEKPATLEYFAQEKRTKCGLQARCRACSRSDHEQYNRKLGHQPRAFAVVDGELRCCTKCGEWKPNTTEYFYRDAQKVDGVSPRCKICDGQNLKRWRGNNPDKQFAKSRRERDKYRERLREYGRRYMRRQVEDGRSKVAFNRRRARKRSLPDTLTSDEWQRAVEYFNGCCAICGRARGFWHTIAADHWIPLSSPDCPGTVKTNILPLCHGEDGCNNRKGKRNPIEFVETEFGKRKAKAILARIQTYFDSLT